jgi:hypothetical protein
VVVVSVAKRTVPPVSDPAERRPDSAVPQILSVWATAQQAGPSQRRGRYVPASVKHPARMLPAIAAHAVASYTQPGDLVFDPMCGIGTTLVEAVHAGRDAIGVEYESRWSDIADANLALAHTTGSWPTTFEAALASSPRSSRPSRPCRTSFATRSARRGP